MFYELGKPPCPSYSYHEEGCVLTHEFGSDDKYALLHPLNPRLLLVKEAIEL